MNGQQDEGVRVDIFHNLADINEYSTPPVFSGIIMKHLSAFVFLIMKGLVSMHI